MLFSIYINGVNQDVTPGGIKHRDAFKRAMHDWTVLPQEQRATLKPGIITAMAEVANGLPTVDLPAWPEIHEELDDDDVLIICIPSAPFEASMCPQCESPFDSVGPACFAVYTACESIDSCARKLPIICTKTRVRTRTTLALFVLLFVKIRRASTSSVEHPSSSPIQNSQFR